VIARIGAEFGVELDLEALFEHPTLSALASEIDIRRHASTQVVERVDITTTEEASFSQQRLWFLDRLDPNASIAYNLPVCLRLREFAALYTDFDQDRSDPLPALPIQYAHHAAWQRASRDTDVHREQLAYWRSQLVDAPALLQLPTNRPRPSTQSYRGGRVRFV